MPLKHVYLVGIIFLGTLPLCLGQNVVFPLIKELKGNVKSVKEISYAAVIKADKLVKGAEIKKSNYLLDTKNQLIEKDDYDSAGTILERYVANYDNNENPLEEMQYTPDSVLNKYKYRYDGKNNRVGWMSFTKVDTAIARGSYHYDDKGRITSDSLFDGKNRFAYCESFAFDGEDHLVKESHISVHGDKTYDSYEFDMDGDPMQDTKTGPDGSTISVSRLKYVDGKLVQADVITSDNDNYTPLLKKQYDNAGRLIHETKFFANNTVDKTIKYDSAGHVILDSTHFSTGIPAVKFARKFNSRGDTLEKASYLDNDLIKKFTYQYDAKRNNIEIDYQLEKGGDTFKIVRENDKTGNPIKEILYDNGQPVAITEREIVYYQ